MIKTNSILVTLSLTLLTIAGLTFYIKSTPMKYYFMGDLVMLPVISNGYILQNPSTPVEENEAPILPDLKQYTHEAVLKKAPAIQPGNVSVQLLANIKEMEKFSEVHRLEEFSTLQNRTYPRAIVIMSGTFDTAAIYKKIQNPNYLEKIDDHNFLLKIPLLVGPRAKLVIAGTEETLFSLKMSQKSGGFLVNAGKLFVMNADVSGWDHEQNDYAWYKDQDSFRPFLASWSGSETYLSRSAFRHLGYGSSKSYGITYSVDNDILKVHPNLPRPKGWIIESLFEEVYYGFYSYEADDVAIIGNTYKDNIVYGIDPHDRSNRLIIAHNDVFGTKERHGIITSREVNDSWIIHNRSWNNKGSGIMLDRSSEDNTIAYNETFENGSDGITLFESPNNSIYKNDIYNNQKSGIRVRNSWDVIASDNNVHDNRIAVEVYASHIESDKRDFQQDPYTYRAGITLINGKYHGNTNGLFKFRNFDYFRFKNIEAFKFNQKTFTADLSPFKKFMPPLTVKDNSEALEFISKPIIR